MKRLLIDLGLSSQGSFEKYYPRVRDRDDVSVLKCNLSDVIILSSSDHISVDDYHNKEFVYYGQAPVDRASSLLKGLDDNYRRMSQFKQMVTGKKWLDVGTGAGGILDMLSPFARMAAAVEPQNSMRSELLNLGYRVYPFVADVADVDYEVVTLFHVLEHLLDPIETLADIRSRMLPNAKLVVEVPHARDILLSHFQLESFKSFTFWSEHLILHTRESLERVLKASGFGKISISGYQRYPLSNHLHWLAMDEPGGHVAWSHFNRTDLEVAYANMLSSLDVTDTLIAVAHA